MEKAEYQPVPESPAARNPAPRQENRSTCHENPSNRPEGECFSLTEEINLLRKVMTDTFSREASFTSEQVMAISRELDHKINEYMRKVRIKLGYNPSNG